jgi:aquaporin TIP
MEDAFRRSVAEFIGTFALVFAGAGSILVAAAIQEQSILGVAFAHGLAIAVMASAVGHISGAHFNPAVTFGFLVTGRMNPLLAACYWVAQFAAAVFAAAVLKWIFPNGLVDANALGTPRISDQIGTARGLAMEIVLTVFLVWVIFATAADPGGTFKSIAGLAIGLTITMDILVGGPLTGAAMNPARAFGPQLVAGEWANAWVYFVGPLAGAAFAALLYDWLYLRRRYVEPVGPPETGLDEPRPGETALS